jgi:hypothetical protein
MTIAGSWYLPSDFQVVHVLGFSTYDPINEGKSPSVLSFLRQKTVLREKIFLTPVSWYNNTSQKQEKKYNKLSFTNDNTHDRSAPHCSPSSGTRCTGSLLATGGGRCWLAGHFVQGQ